MFMFLHAIALALGLLNGVGGDYGHLTPGYGAVHATDTGGSMDLDTGGSMDLDTGGSMDSDTGGSMDG